MDYAYFSLAMSYDKEKVAKTKKEKDSLLAHVINKSDDKSYGALKGDILSKDDALREFKEDIDKAEKMFPRKDAVPPERQTVGTEYDGWDKNKGGGDGPVDVSDKEGLLDSAGGQEKQGEREQDIRETCQNP